MYTCEKCNKKYQTEAIPHFLESYFCDDCFVKGQREKMQEQIMLMGDNLDHTILQEKLNEIYSNHNKNALKFLKKKDREKNKELILQEVYWDTEFWIGSIFSSIFVL